MRVYEVMSKAVETVKPAVHASEAKTRMRQRKIHHLVVTAGLASCRASCPTAISGGPKLPKVLGDWTVGDLMTSPVVTVTTRTPVRRAAALMKGRSIGSLVVTSPNGKVAGIVTVADLLELHCATAGTRSRTGRCARRGRSGGGSRTERSRAATFASCGGTPSGMPACEPRIAAIAPACGATCSAAISRRCDRADHLLGARAVRCCSTSGSASIRRSAFAPGTSAGCGAAITSRSIGTSSRT